MAGAQVRQQVVERGADVAHVDLDVGERRRAERDDDVVGAGGVGGAIGQLEPPRALDALEQLLGARLLERHPARAHGVQDRLVVVDAEHAQAAIGEAERQRQADAAEADDRDGPLFTHLSGLTVAARLTGAVMRFDAARARWACPERGGIQWASPGRWPRLRSGVKPGFAGMPARFPGERDRVQAGDLSLALDARRVALAGGPG